MTKLSLVCCYEKPAPVSGFPRLPADEALVDTGFFKSAAMDGRFWCSENNARYALAERTWRSDQGRSQKNCAAAMDGRR
ncbi:hypothetical protein [Rhodanobacter sp. KK11]|uniref:hypothetical protein n=1 Tax=Rhodanobacter sp. KK11 TaxID=3083255 RepID=UPI002966B20D|nr:hypothetical protein [Rhodanobacter sp. KK11]MDW2980681.1 hypothetical protein [Rhodanobacter sp. KK11]